MKNNTIVFICYVALILMPLLCCAQNVKQSNKAIGKTQGGKVIARFDKNYYDFGQIRQGESGEVVFELENQGGGLLNVTSVKTSCGCVLVDYSRHGLMRNEKGYIRVKYNTNIIGEIKRSVVVTTNDEDNPKIVLRLIGEVVENK